MPGTGKPYLKKHLGDYQPKPDEKRRENISRNSLGIINQAFPTKAGTKNLDEKMAKEPHAMLLGDAEAMRYLTEERRLTLETINKFNLGLKVEANGSRWLTIPHYQKGKLLNVKSRSLPPLEKEFRRVKDCPSVLFNGDCIEGAEEVYICEGEIDTLTLLQEYTSKGVVGVTAGAGSFDPAWIDHLGKVKRIYLCYDPDEPGQRGAREAARRLGYDRCFNVALPDGQDINEYFRDHTFMDFEVLVGEAHQFDVSGIISVEQGIEKFRVEISRPEQNVGLTTPWPSVNKRIKTGFQPGELIVLSAPPKIGKSTWALQICAYNALLDIPSLFFCLEMRPMKIIEKIIQCHTKKESVGPEEIEAARQALSGKPLYLGHWYRKPELNGIIETLKAAVKRYGLKLVTFDHLHFLCRSITNQVQEIGLAVQAFKFLAEELEVPIILIAQPRKIQPDAIMTAMDLKDSISIYSDCDHLIILHRIRKASEGGAVKEGMETQEQAFDPITLVRVEASRYNPGGEALLHFHGEFSFFDEVKRPGDLI